MTERTDPPALKQLLATAAEDYNHPAFGFDDLLVMLRDAYAAGAEHGTHTSAAAAVEIAESKYAGWVWRCWPCDITATGLTEHEAHKQARQHEVSDLHRRMAA